MYVIYSVSGPAIYRYEADRLLRYTSTLRVVSDQVLNAEHPIKPEAPWGELPLEFSTFVFVTSVSISFIPYFGSHVSFRLTKHAE